MKLGLSLFLFSMFGLMSTSFAQSLLVCPHDSNGNPLCPVPLFTSTDLGTQPFTPTNGTQTTLGALGATVNSNSATLTSMLANPTNTLKTLGGYPLTGVMATNAANGGVVGTTLVPQAQKNGERLSTADFGILPGGTSDVFGPARNAMPTGGVLYLPSAGAQGWQAPSYGTPEGMSFAADGPNIQANQLLGEGTGTWTWGKAWAARLPHNNGNGVTAYSMSASTYGSGYPTNDQTVLAIKANKDLYNQSNVVSGGLGGIVMSVYNGSPSGSQSDTYAYNSYVGVGYASGFAVIAEEKIAEGCSNYTTNCYETDVQKGIENSAPGGAHLGEQWAAGLGVHQALFRVLGSTAGGDSSTTAYQQTGITGRWTDVILNQLNNITNFQLTDTGAIIQASDGTAATQISFNNVAGTDTWLNGSGTTILQLGQNGTLTTGGNIVATGYDIGSSTIHVPGWSTGYDASNGAMQLGTGTNGANPYMDWAYWNGSASVSGSNDVRWQNYKLGAMTWITPGGQYYWDNGSGYIPNNLSVGLGVGVGGATVPSKGLAVQNGTTTDTLTATGQVYLDTSHTLWVQEVNGKFVFGTGTTHLAALDSSGNFTVLGKVTALNGTGSVP